MRFEGLPDLPDAVMVRIEVPRGSFVKRRPDGRIDFVSPLPCPYNYGSIEGTRAPDGDPFDALVLGPRLPLGVRYLATVRAAIGFVDDGERDPKIVCSAAPLTAADRRGVEAFFHAYAWLKRALHLVRPRRGPTRVEGWIDPRL
jgi:inorganic pyrophosphatase